MKKKKNSTVINDFMITEEKSFPPNSNPFNHDVVRMGANVGMDVVVMYDSHISIDHVILVHIPTGKRLFINMPTEV